MPLFKLICKYAIYAFHVFVKTKLSQMLNSNTDSLCKALLTSFFLSRDDVLNVALALKQFDFLG